MLERFRRDLYVEFPRDMPMRGAVMSGGTIDARIVEQRSALIEKGLPALVLLSQDGALCDWIDELPLDVALEQAIPRIEQSFIDADVRGLQSVLDEGEEVIGGIGPVLKRTFDELHAYAYKRKYEIQPKELRRLHIPFVRGGDSPLDAQQKPDDIRLVKMFSPESIVSSWKTPTDFELLQSKLLRTPFVTSSYVNQYSMTYHGVGVSVMPSRIIRSYPTDVDSGPTTPLYSPDPDALDEDNVQVTTWDDVRRLSVVRNAHTLNPFGFWYPELFIELAQIQSVVVRPYHSWVAKSYQCLGGVFDRHRAVAAVMLARSLGVPIEVLE